MSDPKQKKCENFAGLANKRVTIMKRTDTPDNYGGTTVAWSNLIGAPSDGGVWAIIEPWIGREKYTEGQKQSIVDTRITIRYLDAMKDTRDAAKMKVVFAGRTFSILYSKNLDEELMSNFNSRYQREGKAFQMLFCSENAPEN